MTRPTPRTSTEPTATPIGRRRFLAAGAAAAAVSIVKPHHVRGSQANAKITLGLIGCGNRGGWISNLFAANGNYQFVACADYFRDRVDPLGDKLGVDAKRRYHGLTGYQGLLASPPDAVVVESPPYFHPQHARAAVEAGCHVYVAKPLAVDVPGCLTIEAAGKKATARNLCFLVDFQTRANALYQEAVRRVHEGQIGPLVNGEAVYYAGPTWTRQIKSLAQHPHDPEAQLRSWGVFRTLSGDIITEQNIHAIDVASWVVDQAPVKAWGTGGRKARRHEPGDCYDHFAVVFQYPHDLVINFTSGQFSRGYQDIGCRVFGPDGSIETHYFGEVGILGPRPMKPKPVESLFKNGVVNNIATFHRCITQGDHANSTVAPGVRSNLTTILGRTAAYRRAEVTWEEILQAKEAWHFAGLDQLKA